MLLLIDNYDSFTYNLVQFLGDLGADTKVVRNDAISAQDALKLDPKSDRAWFQVARAQERQGQLNDAVESLVQAISLNSRASSYYYVLSNVYRRLGKKQESQKAMDMFTQLDRESNELEKKRRTIDKPAGSPPRPGGERE